MRLKASREESQSVLFLLPSIPGPSAGPASTWIPAAGWAQAVAEEGRQAWVVTPLGIMNSNQTFEFATSRRSRSSLASTSRGKLLTLLGTIKKDVRDAFRALRFRDSGFVGPWDQGRVTFVWQRHELFQSCGARAAKRLGAPLVLFVDAPIVWEAKQWGVARPGWGKLLERFVERPALLRADLICCISGAVAEQVIELGASRNRVLVTPNATDHEHFRPGLNEQDIKGELGLDRFFVIGWVGSFRKFHGLETLLGAVAELQVRVKDIALLMVGDGYEKERIARMAQNLGINRVVFTGVIGYQKLPQYINAMDVSVLSDCGSNIFHYSPLKLQEYLACGRAVVAPRTGQIAEHLRDGIDSVLVEPGSESAIANAIELLYKDTDLRKSIGFAARRTAIKTGGWRRVLKDVEASLRRVVPGPID